jgi:hypothetical protein
MPEKQKPYYECAEDTSKCNYWLVVESCRQCLFHTLCHLEKARKCL